METFKNCNFVSIVVTVSITTLLLIFVYPRNYDKLPNIDNMILDNLEKIHKDFKNHAKNDQEKMKLLQKLMSITQEVRDNLYYKGKSISLIKAEAIGILIGISEEIFKLSASIFQVMSRKVEKYQIALY